jgi:ABC-2 type transport system ATP-binding protein
VHDVAERETPHLYSYLTGPEYLTLVGRLRHISEALLEHKVDRFLELFGLGASRYSPLSAYSKGMRQKVLIMAALLHNPDLVILDEPSSGLDVSATLVLRELIRELAEDGKVVLYSSHVLERVEQVCSSVVILREGEVVASESVSRLRQLMEKPSLEEVFTKLAVREDAREIAEQIAATMRLEA